MDDFIKHQMVVEVKFLSPIARDILSRAYRIAQETGQPLNLVPLMLAILERDDHPMAQMLIAHGVTADDVRSAKRGRAELGWAEAGA